MGTVFFWAGMILVAVGIVGFLFAPSGPARLANFVPVETHAGEEAAQDPGPAVAGMCPVCDTPLEPGGCAVCLADLREIIRWWRISGLAGAAGDPHIAAKLDTAMSLVTVDFKGKTALARTAATAFAVRDVIDVLRLMHDRENTIPTPPY